MISVSEARARVLAGVAPVGAEVVGLGEALGRVLAEPVVARVSHPSVDVSAMDGYAVRAADAAAGARLRVIGAAPAGAPFAGAVGAGEAVRCLTGGVVPAGADAIVIQEQAVAEAGWIAVREGVAAGRFIRRTGQDFRAGEALISAGRAMTVRDVALAAAANLPWLSVYRRPVVAILTTGDEVVLPGEPVPPGGVTSANTHGLAALALAAGAKPVMLPMTRDDSAAITAAAAAVRADLLVTSGGVSVGDHDAVRDGLARAGMALDFWRIAMRPGKPLMVGRLGAMPVIGVPGNPVSALVCGLLFVRPVLARLAGLPDTDLPTEPAVLCAALPANDGREDYLRAVLRGGTVVPAAAQDSGMLATLARADALIVRAPFAPAASAGDAVSVVRLSTVGV